MSRAAILPTPGDPFLLHYWYTLFKWYWRDEIDRLYIHLNTPVAAEVVEYEKNLVADDPKVTLLYTDHQLEHGEAIKRILPQVTETHTMLIEDDAFVFVTGAVGAGFRLLEKHGFEVVGSPRGSCGLELYKAAVFKWLLNDVGDGERGPNFWPCYFFSETKLLKQIDNFGSKFWHAGEVVEPIGMAFDTDQHGDTFVEASLQIRAIITKKKIAELRQYHTHPDDLEHYREKRSIWDGKAGWCHIGSLSSGISGLLRDDHNRPLARMHLEKPQGPTELEPKPTTDFEKREYERRVQWWLTFFEGREPDRLDEFATYYQLGIMQIINQFKLSMKRIRRRQKIYEEVLHDF